MEYGTETVRKKELRHNFFFTCSMSETLPASESTGNLSSSLASRNPTRDVIPTRVRDRPKISDAQKITAEAKRLLNGENAAALQLEIDQVVGVRDTEISRIGKKYNKTEKYIKHILTNETNYNGTRAPSLRNALVHAKGIEMNEGK